jgi:hypothetical protein
MESAMMAEKAMSRAQATVLGGSNTANKLADVQDAGVEIINNALVGGMAGGPHGAAASVAQSLFQKALGKASNPMLTEAAGSRIADMLTTVPGKDKGEIMNRLLQQAAVKQQAQRYAAKRIALSGLVGGNALARSSAQQHQ